MIVDKHGGEESPAPAPGDVPGDSHRTTAAEVTRLKEMLTQRDNEISILWHGAASFGVAPHDYIEFWDV